jgi:hypothetical protein
LSSLESKGRKRKRRKKEKRGIGRQFLFSNNRKISYKIVMSVLSKKKK